MNSLKIFILFLFLVLCPAGMLRGQSRAVERFLASPEMQGALFACSIRDADSGLAVFDDNPDLQMTPASVMKLVTTAAALDILGPEFHFTTEIAYDGTIEGGILRGNLYIIGSGDPTLGSSHFPSAGKPDFLATWTDAVRRKGIRHVTGQIIADDSAFDTEGVSPKWSYEDLGSYYGAGSYALNVYDNLYRLTLSSGAPGSRPAIVSSQPSGVVAHFHNYLSSAAVRTDSTLILGAPFAEDRFLYGVIPSGRKNYTLKGDIPDPALFLAKKWQAALASAGIRTDGTPSTARLLREKGTWKVAERHTLAAVASPSLAEIIRVTNHVSHNLYADALLKAIAIHAPGERLPYESDYACGIRKVRSFWRTKGIDVTNLYMYDGSGLAPTSKTTSSIIATLLVYMHRDSPNSQTFFRSLPRAGRDGSVRNFLKGTALEGSARLKSGSMSRVKAYAGYIRQGEKTFAVAFFFNYYHGDGSAMTRKIASLLQTLFPEAPKEN